LKTINWVQEVDGILGLKDRLDFMSEHKILIVDDDEQAIQALTCMLAEAGRLRFALTGREALVLAREWEPDLILLDAAMPEISGFEVCRLLKSDSALEDIPVVFVSSHQHALARAEASARGAVDFIAKPMQSADVVAIVRAQLRARQAVKEVAQKLIPFPDLNPIDTAPCILIVDDDSDAILALRTALDFTRAKFLFATSGEGALALTETQQPDLILLDIQMPGVDGFEVCRQLRERPALQFVPVVFITRHSDPDTEARALAMFGTDFIAKPYSAAVLQARIRNLLLLKQQTDASLRAVRDHWQRIGEKRVTGIVAAASDAIISANSEGEIVLINSAACQLFELESERVLGLPLEFLIPSGCFHAVDINVQARQTGSHEASKRVIIRRENGTSFAADVALFSSGEDGDRLTTVIVRDLTERDRIEQATRARLTAESASQTKTMMLSYLAHEVGNPLNGILGFAQLMAMDRHNPLPEAQSERLQQVLQAGRHLQTIVRDAMDINRFEAGRFEFRSEILDIRPCIREAAEAVLADAQQSRVGIEVWPIETPLLVLADQARLRQILVNLLSNAIKYNRHPGRVSVSATIDADAVRINIADQGSGMTASEVDHLFEPFNRLGRAGPGSGVGLVLTRLLVTAMGGQISVRSAVGQGSCFTVAFPVAGQASAGAGVVEKFG
jgi:PAS domain S-box-containing protein